jgi:hypothetical protein
MAAKWLFQNSQANNQIKIAQFFYILSLLLNDAVSMETTAIEIQNHHLKGAWSMSGHHMNKQLGRKLKLSAQHVKTYRVVRRSGSHSS